MSGSSMKLTNAEHFGRRLNPKLVERSSGSSVALDGKARIYSGVDPDGEAIKAGCEFDSPDLRTVHGHLALASSRFTVPAATVHVKDRYPSTPSLTPPPSLGWLFLSLTSPIKTTTNKNKKTTKTTKMSRKIHLPTDHL